VTSLPPKPVELAEGIICSVNRHVEFDLTPIRAELAERLREPSEEYIWPRAERIASDAIEAVWSEELVEQCARALAEAHEEFLVAAARCLEAADELEHKGRESWIAGAVLHRVAFDAAWDVLAEDGILLDDDCFPPESD
jgi:hypothetical protein